MQQNGFEKYKSVPKIQKSLNVLATVYNDKIRNFILACYTSKRLLDYYELRRKEYDDMQHTSGKLGYGQAHRRKILEFPNGYIADFVDRIMTSRLGPDWIKNKRNYKNDLIRPWLTIPEKFL